MNDLSPYSGPRPPKTITKVDDDRFLDFTCLHTWILLGTIGLSLVLFNFIARSTGVFRFAYIASLLVIIIYGLIIFQLLIGSISRSFGLNFLSRIFRESMLSISFLYLFPSLRN